MAPHTRILLAMIVALHLVCLPESPLHAQPEGRVKIPSTRISLIPPPCYKFVRNGPILYCSEIGASLTIVESPNSPAELFASYSDSGHLAEQDYDAISKPEDITIDGVPGKKFNIRKRAGLLTDQTEIFRIFVAGDSLGTFTAIVNYPDSVAAKAVEPLIKAVSTIEWDHSSALRPEDLLGFTIAPPAGLSVARAEARWELFTPDGIESEEGTPAPRFTIALLSITIEIEYFAEAERRKLMESLIERAYPDIKILQVLEFNKKVLDGIPAFETVSSGRTAEDGKPVTVYYTLLFHPGEFVALVGLAEGEQAATHVGAFKDAVQSFRRRNLVVDVEGECGKALAARRYSEAAACFDRSLAASPSATAARLGKAEALRLQGKIDQSISEYQRVLSEDRYCEQALLGRARAHVAKNEWSDALPDYNLALALNSTSAALFLERGAARAKNYNTFGAEQDYQRALAISPKSASVYVSLGDVQSGDDAIASYTKAIALDRSYAPAYKKRAEMHMIRRNYAKAIPDLDAAIRLQPGDKKLHADRGMAYSSLGKLSEALRDMEKGPDEAAFLSSRAFLKGLTRQVDGAMKDFSRSVELDSTEWMTYFLRGIVHYLNGGYRAARADFRHAVTFSPNAEARAWLFFSEVQAYNWSDATANLDRYVSSTASATEDWHGIVKFLLGKIDEAQLVRSIAPFGASSPYLSEKERLDEARCDTYFAIGMLNYTTGRKIGAKPYWRKCMESKRTSLVSYGVAAALLQGDWVK